MHNIIFIEISLSTSISERLQDAFIETVDNLQYPELHLPILSQLSASINVVCHLFFFFLFNNASTLKTFHNYIWFFMLLKYVTHIVIFTTRFDHCTICSDIECACRMASRVIAAHLNH